MNQLYAFTEEPGALILSTILASLLSVRGGVTGGFYFRQLIAAEVPTGALD
jgi:hypothetical protein